MKRLSNDVRNCLEKALDSALLAVETYNKPAVKFKSGGYIVLMSIAWTSLLHAIFLKQKIKPFGISDKKRPKMGLFFSYMPKRDLKLLVSPLSIRGMSL